MIFKFNFPSMKTSQIKHTNKLIIFVFTILMNLSCSDKPNNTQDDGNLTINKISIENYIDNKESNNLSLSNTQEKIKVSYYEDFDAITDISTQSPISNYNLNDSKIKKSILTKKIVAETFLSTSKYRLIFFKSDGTKVEDLIITAGQNPIIFLQPGVNYKWVAYSTNSSTLPDCPNNIIPKNEIANKDFLYDSGNITIGNSNNNISIIFKRFTTQYVVFLDTRGMFAKISQSTRVKLRNTAKELFTKADFDIFQGEYDYSTEESISSPTGQLISVNGDLDQQKIIFYSADKNITNVADDLKLTIEPLNLILDDNSERTFSSTTLNLYNEVFTGTTTRGNRYSIHATLIESGVKTSTNANAPTWARSNLWYDENNPTGKYRFRVSPFFRDTENKLTGTFAGVYTDKNDLWRRLSSTPTGNDNIDPCRKVYPENLWKTPTSADFATLSTKPDSAFILYRGEPYFNGFLGLVGNNQYYELGAMWKAASNYTSHSAYSKLYIPSDVKSHSRNLYFNGIGFIDASNNIINRPVAASLLSVGNLLGVIKGIAGAGYYWSESTLTPSFPYHFNISIINASLVSLDVGLLKLAVLNTNNINASRATDLTNNNRMNIRCVRSIN